jgi:hypothetical protein
LQIHRLHRSIGCPEIDRCRLDLGEPAAGANGLIIDVDPGLGAVVGGSLR